MENNVDAQKEFLFDAQVENTQRRSVSTQAGQAGRITAQSKSSRILCMSNLFSTNLINR
jgi:hypothetical protein